MASFVNTWNRAGVKLRRNFIALIHEHEVGDLPTGEDGHG
jgi:hypothetical protein